MNTSLFRTLGGIAGLAGIALGVVLILFQGVLEVKFLPDKGLTSPEAYQVIIALLILTFGLAGVGIVSWLISSSLPPGSPLPPNFLYVIVLLLLAVLGGTVACVSRAFDRRSDEAAVLPPAPTPSASASAQPADESKKQPAPAPVPTASASPTPMSPAKQEITRPFRVCTGEYERACDPHEAYLYCYVDVNAWAKARCDRFKVQQLNVRGGNKCGYALYEVLCTSTL